VWWGGGSISSSSSSISDSSISSSSINKLKFGEFEALITGGFKFLVNKDLGNSCKSPPPPKKKCLE